MPRLSRPFPWRVAVFGTESTGKSDLAATLARHYDEPWAPEYVREFWDTHGGQVKGIDLGAIASGQIANEETAAARARRLVFCDTELLTNVLWADLLFPGHCPAWVRDEAEVRSRRYALYLLCDTDLPWEPDPQRSFPDPSDRERLREKWRDTLVQRGLPFAVVTGRDGGRAQQAIAAIDAILGQAS